VYVQKGFEIEEPDFPKYKQRATLAGTVVDGPNSASGEGPAEDKGGANEMDQGGGGEAYDGQSNDRIKKGAKKIRERSVEEKRKLLGLDGNLDSSVKAKPSTNMSKDILKMFAT
jgi:hypothetical protein